jgi:hypothetical protein
MGGVLRRAGEHGQVEALLSTYLDGRASEAERALVERHLKSCADCARNLATLRATVAAVKEMPRVRAPRSFALPRSMARRPQTATWTYPLLRAATAIAAFLFVLTVAGDIFLRSPLTTSTRMAAPATLAPTSVATQSEGLQSGSQPTEAAIAPGPQKIAPPAAPAPLSAPPQLEPTAPGTATPVIAAAAKAAPATPAEPPVEQPLTDRGMGGGGGVGAAPPAPQPTPAAPAFEAAPTATLVAPTAAASSAPTSIARVPAPQLSAGQRQVTTEAARPVTSPLRIAENVLAALVLVLGMATWIVRRRSR